MKFEFNINPKTAVPTNDTATPTLPPALVGLTEPEYRAALTGFYGVADGKFFGDMIFSESFDSNGFNLFRNLVPVGDVCDRNGLIAGISPELISRREVLLRETVTSYYKMVEYLRGATTDQRQTMLKLAEDRSNILPVTDAVALEMIRDQGLFPLLDGLSDPNQETVAACDAGISKYTTGTGKRFILAVSQKLGFLNKKLASRIQEKLEPAAKLWKLGGNDYTAHFKHTAGHQVKISVRTIKLGPKSLSEIIPQLNTEVSRIKATVAKISKIEHYQLQLNEFVRDRMASTPEELEETIRDTPAEVTLPYPDPDYMKHVLESNAWETEVRTVIEKIESTAQTLLRDIQTICPEPMWPTIAGAIQSIWDGFYKEAAVIGADTLTYCRAAIRQFEDIPIPDSAR